VRREEEEKKRQFFYGDGGNDKAEKEVADYLQEINIYWKFEQSSIYL